MGWHVCGQLVLRQGPALQIKAIRGEGDNRNADPRGCSQPPNLILVHGLDMAVDKLQFPY